MPTSIAGQTDEELGGPGSVLARQRRDHVELDRLLAELEGGTGAAQRRCSSASTGWCSATRSPRRSIRKSPRAASKGLAGIAALVERTPPARKGDRPPTSG